MNTRNLNLLKKNIENYNFDKIEYYINNKIDVDEPMQHESQEIFEVTNSIFNAIFKNINHKEKLLDIYQNYINKTNFDLNILYQDKRIYNKELNIYSYINFKLPLITNIENSNILDIIKGMNNIINKKLNEETFYSRDHSNNSSFLFKLLHNSFIRYNKQQEKINYTFEFYKNNFKFTNKDSNTQLLISISLYIIKEPDIKPEISNFLNYLFDNIEYDKDEFIQNFTEKLKNRYNINYIESCLSKILIKNNLDYIIKNNEKIYLYPYFFKEKEYDAEIIDKYIDKKGIFFTNSQNHINFNKLEEYCLKSLNYNIPIKINNIYEINSINDFKYLKDFHTKQDVFHINTEDFIKKFDYINNNKNNIKINYDNLLKSTSDFIENIIPKYNEINYKDTLFNNLSLLLEQSFNNIDFSKKEQRIIETFFSILRLPNSKDNTIIKNKVIELIQKIEDKEKYSFNNLNYNDLLLTLKPNKNNYLAHIELEKLQLIKISKNINKINDKLINGNSLYTYLFSMAGKYKNSNIYKRFEICDLLDDNSKIDPIYCYFNNEKMTRSAYFFYLLTNSTEYNIIMPHLIKLNEQYKKEKRCDHNLKNEEIEKFIRYNIFNKIYNDYSLLNNIEIISNKIYTDNDDYLLNFIKSFDEHQIEKNKYISGKNLTIDVLDKIKDVNNIKILKNLLQIIELNFKDPSHSYFKAKNFIEKKIIKESLNEIHLTDNIKKRL